MLTLKLIELSAAVILSLLNGTHNNFIAKVLIYLDKHGISRTFSK